MYYIRYQCNILRLLGGWDRSIANRLNASMAAIYLIGSGSSWRNVVKMGSRAFMYSPNQGGFLRVVFVMHSDQTDLITQNSLH